MTAQWNLQIRLHATGRADARPLLCGSKPVIPENGRQPSARIGRIHSAATEII